MLPDVAQDYFTCGHGDIEKAFYTETTNWTTINERSKYEERYPYMPDRIIDCLLAMDSHISFVKLEKIASNHEILRTLINLAHRDKDKSIYDLTRPMRRRNG